MFGAERVKTMSATFSLIFLSLFGTQGPHSDILMMERGDGGRGLTEVHIKYQKNVNFRINLCTEKKSRT